MRERERERTIDSIIHIGSVRVETIRPIVFVCRGVGGWGG